MFRISVLPLLLLLALNLNQNPKEEIDKFWGEVSRTVATGDFEGYSKTFHKDAVLVNGISETSYPIANALSGWKQGFEDTKAGKMKAGVEFRFSKRLHGETTAHDTGIFKYFAQYQDSNPSVSYIHFEGLMTKVNGEWKMIMEYQISLATEEEWKSLK